MQPGEREFWEGVRAAGSFFMKEGPVFAALRAIASALEAAGVPYAIGGAMALNEYGYRRVTSDVDILVTAEGLARAKAALLGRGYVEKFPGSRGLRDTVNDVQIDVLVTGEFPGDGKPKPVQFPDPGKIARRGELAAFLPLETLVELKLASGMTAPHRLKDLADVLELIRHAALPRELGARLDPFVRAKFDELWLAAQVKDPE